MRNALRPLIAVAIFLACFVIPALAAAHGYEGFGPFVSRNQNPIYLQNLSLTPRKAEALPEGTLDVRIDSAYSNLFEKEANAQASLNLDMELWRLAVMASYGFGRGLEAGIQVPMYEMWGGFLDGFIQKFHKFFGFPNGGRDRVPNGEFHYRLDAGGRTAFDFPSVDWGLGDVSIYVKHQLIGQDDDLPAVAWFADLKFPTGRRSRGLGSGSPDFGIGLAMDNTWKRLHGYVNVGWFILGGNEYIDELMYNQMFSYMLAGELSILPSLSLVVQIEGGTPLLHGTGLDQWDGMPMDLVIGFKGEEKDIFGDLGDLTWQVAFAEDITSQGPSVDFTVYMSLGVRFDLKERKRAKGDWLAGKP